MCVVWFSLCCFELGLLLWLVWFGWFCCGCVALQFNWLLAALLPSAVLVLVWTLLRVGDLGGCLG